MDVVGPFLCIGITLAILNLAGTIPVEKDILKINSSGLDNKPFSVFNISVGILKGPEDLPEASVEITSSISFVVVGEI